MCLSPQGHCASKTDLIQQFLDWESSIQQQVDLDPTEAAERIQYIRRWIYKIDQSKPLTQRLAVTDPGQNFYVSQLEQHRILTQIFITVAQEFLLTTEDVFPARIFLEESLWALKNIKSPEDDPLLFLKQYLDFSGITEPCLAQEFEETWAYTSREQTSAANKLSFDNQDRPIAFTFENSTQPASDNSRP